MRNSKTWDTINLASFEWLTETSKLDFFKHCQVLTEFKLTGDAFDIQSDQLHLMIDTFPPNILKIDLSLCQNLNDLHIEKLVLKCNKIQGNLLRNIDNKTVRRQVISICLLCTYVLFSVTHF